MAEAAVVRKGMAIETLLMDVYLELIKKSLGLEEKPTHFQTYNSEEIRQINIRGKVEELTIKCAFNDNLVLQKNHKTESAILYVPSNWEGSIVIESRPEHFAMDESLKKPELRIIFW